MSIQYQRTETKSNRDLSYHKVKPSLLRSLNLDVKPFYSLYIYIFYCYWDLTNVSLIWQRGRHGWFYISCLYSFFSSCVTADLTIPVTYVSVAWGLDGFGGIHCTLTALNPTLKTAVCQAYSERVLDTKNIYFGWICGMSIVYFIIRMWNAMWKGPLQKVLLQ